MKIETVNIDKINPATYNPRVDLKPGDEEYEKLKRSINEFGYVEPLVWNKRTGNLVGGHQRLKILIEQGFKEVQVSVVDLDSMKEKALNIALNKISGSWDEEKLSLIFKELQESQEDFEIGFSQKEIDDLIDQFSFDDDSTTDFLNQELLIDNYGEDEFQCKCPRCGFLFDPKEVEE